MRAGVCLTRRMIIRSEPLIRCNGINSTSDLSELMKIAAKAGYLLSMRRNDDDDDNPLATRSRWSLKRAGG